MPGEDGARHFSFQAGARRAVAHHQAVMRHAMGAQGPERPDQQAQVLFHDHAPHIGNQHLRFADIMGLAPGLIPAAGIEQRMIHASAPEAHRRAHAAFAQFLAHAWRRRQNQISAIVEIDQKARGQGAQGAKAVIAQIGVKTRMAGGHHRNAASAGPGHRRMAAQIRRADMHQ